MYRCVLLSERDDLLGSVLHNMVASWALSQEIGANYIACYHEPRWKRPNLCLDEIFDVVSLPFRLYRGRPTDFCPADRLIRFGNESADFPRLYREGVKPEDFPEGSFICSTAMAMLPRPGQTRKEAEQEFSRLFSALPQHKAIRRAIDLINARMRLGDAIAVHLRRGDILTYIRSFKVSDPVFAQATEWYAYRYSEIESFLPALNVVDAAAPLLVFSEDSEAARALSRICGRRCLYVPEEFRSEFSELTPTQQDFLEILMMASTKAIVGTASLFAKTGAAMGAIAHFDTRQYQKSEHILRDIVCHLADDPERDSKIPMMVRAYSKVLAIIGAGDEGARLQGVYDEFTRREGSTSGAGAFVPTLSTGGKQMS